MAEDRPLAQLFRRLLEEAYAAESRSVRIMARMARAANEQQTRAKFAKYRKQATRHARALERVFKQLKRKPRERRNPVIAAHRKQARVLAKTWSKSEALDAALLAVAIIVSQYQLALYQSLRTWAGELRMSSVERTLNDVFLEKGAMASDFAKVESQLANRDADMA